MSESENKSTVHPENKTEKPQSSAKRWIDYLAFPLFLAAVLILVYVFRDRLITVFNNRDAARAWVQSKGAWGMFAYIGLEILQVMLFIIPGEVVQVVGGYIYGTWLGTLLSIVGILIGSLFNFWIGRLLGRPFVEAVFKKEKLEKIEQLTSSGRQAAGFFLLFAIPGIPKDALCYFAGMTHFSLPLFMLVSTVGRLPGIFGSSIMGSAAGRGSYTLALVLLAVAMVVFFVGLVFRDQIQAWLEKVLHRDGGRH